MKDDSAVHRSAVEPRDSLGFQARSCERRLFDGVGLAEGRGPGSNPLRTETRSNQ
jgi:hypothetical protein